MLSAVAPEPKHPSDVLDVLTSLSWSNVGVAASLLLLNVLLSFIFGLGLEWAIIISATRCLIQLHLMGLVLAPVFQNGDDPWLVLVMSSVLLTLGAVEAVSKPKFSFRGMFPVVLLSMLLSGAVSMGVGAL